jgi:hypothetical protein
MKWGRRALYELRSSWARARQVPFTKSLAF